MGIEPMSEGWDGYTQKHVRSNNPLDHANRKFAVELAITPPNCAQYCDHHQTLPSATEWW
jgi:hypothetical protein